MDFFKKLFGKREEGGESAFTCEKCGKERMESERKDPSADAKDGTRANVCEFC